MNSIGMGIAASAAADMVQSEILCQLRRIFNNLMVVSVKPVATFPKEGLFGLKIVTSNKKLNISLPNIIILRDLLRFIYILFVGLVYKPKLFIIYNPGLLHFLCGLIFKLFYKTRFVQIIQDINISRIASLCCRTNYPLCTKLYKFADYSIIVNGAIATDFKITKKYDVFPGGLTAQARSLLKSNCVIENIAVFAGALERYNGIDQLIKFWINNNINICLHVFGKGTEFNQLSALCAGSAKVILHGFVEPEIVAKFQSHAKFNFCLRYSIGINRNYFFPSKMFEVLSCPGVPIVNDIVDFDPRLNDFVLKVDKDFSNLMEILNKDYSSRDFYLNRLERTKILLEYDWYYPITRLASAIK